MRAALEKILLHSSNTKQSSLILQNVNEMPGDSLKLYILYLGSLENDDLHYICRNK